MSNSRFSPSSLQGLAAKLPTPAAIRAERARRASTDFRKYCRFVDSNYKTPPHIIELTDTLEKVNYGEIRRALINMPPRHGKSDTASKKFPAYFLGRNPDKKVIVACHSQSLADEFSRYTRDLVREFGKEIHGIELSDESSRVDSWQLKGRQGGLVAAGVGTGITGKGADLLIIDDPIKDDEAAFSDTQREKVWKWYTSTAKSRLAPGGRILVILTRWHEDDLAGRLVDRAKKRGRKWGYTISMPFVAADDGKRDLTPEEMEASQLWPGRYSGEEIEDIKVEAGEYYWNALYQQRPSSPTGSIFRRDWWKYWAPPGTPDVPPFVRIIDPKTFEFQCQSWDCAFKDEKDSDFVVGMVWAAYKADRFAVTQVRDRMDFPATIAAVKAMTSSHPKARAKYIEDKANGTAVISTLKREISGLIPVEPEGGKLVRARAISPQVQSGNVYLPWGAPWVESFIEEHAAFPTGKNDDQVDCTSQALHQMDLRGDAAARARKLVGKK